MSLNIRSENEIADGLRVLLDWTAQLTAADAIRRIERIELETHRPGMSNQAPPTTLAARFSFEHAVAAACVYGEAGVDAFSRE